MKLKKYLAFILLLSVACNSDLSKKYELLEVDEKYKNGQLEEAKEDIDEYLSQTSDNEFAWTMLGHIESDRDNDSLAMIAYEKAIELSPKTVEAITGMGIIMRKKGNYGQASKYYQRAIEIDPQYAEAYSSLVVINLKRRKFDEAVEVGLKGYELGKDNPVIASNLAIAYHYANDSINREKYFTIAKQNGYQNLESLRLIFEGELTIFD